MMRGLLIVGWVMALIAPVGAAAERGAVCQVHMILFVPADVRPPANYQGRMDEFMNYTEAFFRRELARWGHRNLVMPFARSANRRAEVIVIRGKAKTGAYKPVAVRMEVMDHLRSQNRLEGSRQVWWIFVYAGEPPARFSGFLGGLGERIGGWAVCNFDTTPGRIDLAAPLGSEFLEKLALKGMIHELGHGFGMPHIGPLDRDRRGNTLMGPTHINYKRVRGAKEERVYLCEAEAAMLAAHPAFRGAADEPGKLPTPRVEGLKYTADPRRRGIVVSGVIQGDPRALYALVADEANDRPGEYWTKTYVSKVGADGAFEVLVAEPSQAGGTLRTWFIFETGAQTGDGKTRSRGSGVARAYSHGRGGWGFE